MRLFLKRNSPVLYMLVAMIVLYVPWMGRGYVNWEWPHALAGESFSSASKSSLLNAYWESEQANPLGFPILLGILYQIVGFHDWFWLSRVPSLIGSGLILISGWNIFPRDVNKNRSFFYWSSLVMLSPMLFVYSTAVTSDVLPVGLTLLSIALLIYEQKRRKITILLSSLFFGMAATVRYISPYFLGSIVALIFNKQIQIKHNLFHRLRTLFIFGIVSSSVLLICIWWMNSRFNVFISVRRDAVPNFIDGKMWLLTFLKYVSFLGLFGGLLPFAVFVNNLRSYRSKFFGFFFALFTAMVGWFLVSPLSVGEMDFGNGFPGGRFMMRGIETFGLVSGVALFPVFFKQFFSLNRRHKVLLSGMIPYLVLISASRPTQRYLIYAIPIVLLLLVDASNDLNVKLRNLTLGLTAFGFAAVSLLGMSYLRAQGNASENMAVWLERNQVIGQTSASPIAAHAGQHFYGITSSEIKYEVIQTTLDGEKLIKERILHREPMNVLGKITRVYVLREVPKAP